MTTIATMTTRRSPSLHTHRHPSLLTRRHPSLHTHHHPSLRRTRHPSLHTHRHPSLRPTQHPSLHMHRHLSLRQTRIPSLHTHRHPSLRRTRLRRQSTRLPRSLYTHQLPVRPITLTDLMASRRLVRASPTKVDTAGHGKTLERSASGGMSDGVWSPWFGLLERCFCS
jgi:hypothetical protein